ncbi:MAG: efflux RND transporter periplasmic adaptor subunit, partial [Singulisphaera sp.]|nr:efflux RND transporter periplasmic adaptor subunit [Singulisphaera sp.]
MSVVLTSRRWPLKGALPWAALGLCLVLLLSNMWHDTLFHGRSPVASPAVAEPPPSPRAAPAMATSVTLPEGKLKAAGVRTEPARTEVLPVEVGVPGRIDANTD